MLAGLVTLFGATASQAQYEDEYYDEELLGSPDYQDEYQGDQGYNEPEIDVGLFAELGHHGRWHFQASYGWVWRPYVTAGWRPYGDGRWVWTSYGWTWESYEPFGWATYHYGNWTNDFRLGWVWIPGYDWSACRVEWAVYDNYVCWAPLPPPGVYCPRPWDRGGLNVWFTVGAGHFTDPYVSRYCERPRFKSTYVQHATYRSPDRRFVERSSGRKIRTETVAFEHRKVGRHEFKRATKWSDVARPRTNYKPEARAYKPEARALRTTKGGERPEKYAMKTTPRKYESRQYRPQESTRKQSGYDRGGQVRKQSDVRPHRSEQQVRKQSQLRPQRSEQVARKYTGGKSARKQSEVRQQRSVQRDSKAYSATKRSGERKSVSSESRGSKRDVAKGKSSRAHEGSNKGRK